MKHKLIVSVVVSLLAGCVSTNVTPLSNKRYSPVHPDDVVIYLDEADVPAEYEKVALIYSEGDHFWTDESDMFKDVRKRAGKMGANGVIVRGVKEPGTGAKVAQAVIGTEANRRSEVVAIYVIPSAASPRPAGRVY